jgi:hypothetical protein
VGHMVFRNQRNERVEVAIVFENGRRGFPLEPGVEHREVVNTGETVMWGWFPYSGPGRGAGEPDCPASDGDTVIIRDDCRIEG